MSYKQKILTFLCELSEPVDVEKIRKHCVIGNWITALNNCLELYIQGKIAGQKTSRGWIFWLHHEKHLRPWEEIIGTLKALETNEYETTLVISCIQNITIKIPKNTPQTKTLHKLLGQKIAILKTDNPQKPITIRTLTKPQQRTTVALRYCCCVKGYFVGLCLNHCLSCLVLRKTGFFILRYVFFVEERF